MQLVKGRIYRSNHSGRLYRWNEPTLEFPPLAAYYIDPYIEMECVKDSGEAGEAVGCSYSVSVLNLEEVPELLQAFYGS